MNSATCARINLYDQHVMDVIRQNPPELIDYIALWRHLCTLPYRQEAGLVWSMDVLNYFDIGGLLNRLESEFADKVMQTLVHVGAFTPVHTRSIERHMHIVHRGYDRATPENTYSDYTWYRRNRVPRGL